MVEWGGLLMGRFLVLGEERGGQVGHESDGAGLGLGGEAGPDAGGRDFLEALNPDSKRVVNAYLEPGARDALPEQRYQFERHGYFVADRVDSQPGKPVFNRTVGLRDTWAKVAGS